MPDTLDKEQERVELHPPTESVTTQRPFGRWVLGVVAAAILLVVSFAAGWLIRGQDGESAPLYVFRGFLAADGELTDRQVEMVDVTEQYVAAFVARDGDGVASFMVPDGFLALPNFDDRIVRVSDGSLQEWVDDFGRIPNEMNYPVAVHGNQVVLTGQLGEALDWIVVIEFTDSGEVEIVSDTHWAH